MNESLRALCAEVGFDLQRATALLERVQMLDERSHTVADAVRMVHYAKRVFADHERTAQPFSALERRIVVLACLFADVGKSGPEHANVAQRQLIVEMFAVEGVRDDTQPVADFLREHFEDGQTRVARFVELGLSPTMSMREFWNLHSSWTLDIAEAAGLPLEAVAAAATHHLLDDVNPREIVGRDRRFTRAFGDNPAFDRAEKLVIVLDKYDAARHRSQLDHDRAIAWLRERIARNPSFADDRELRELVELIARVLRP